MNENFDAFVEIDAIDVAAELAAEAVCACGCGMCICCTVPELPGTGFAK